MTFPIEIAPSLIKLHMYGHSQQCNISFYNMVGVAVAMVISTMHEKSCIDSHNARKFE